MLTIASRCLLGRLRLVLISLLLSEASLGELGRQLGLFFAKDELLLHKALVNFVDLRASPI